MGCCHGKERRRPSRTSVLDSSPLKIDSSSITVSRTIKTVNQNLVLKLGLYTVGDKTIEVAVKEYDYTQLNVVEKLASKMKIKREAKIMHRMHHDHVITFYGFVEYQDKISLIMEFMNDGSLKAYLERLAREGRQLPPETVFTMATQIVDGAAYLHDQKIFHRDIYDENILVEEDLLDNNRVAVTVKICDFGASFEDANNASAFGDDVLEFGTMFDAILDRVAADGSPAANHPYIKELRNAIADCTTDFDQRTTFAALKTRLINFHNTNISAYEACGCARAAIKSLFGQSPIEIIMVGDESCGKSTILRSIRLGDVQTSTTDNGMAVESLTYKNVSMSSFVLKNESINKSQWPQKIRNPNGIILVIDSTVSDDNLQATKAKFGQFLKTNRFNNKPVLVLGAKKDMGARFTSDALLDGLKTNTKRIGAEMVDQNGSNLHAGVSWLVSQMRK